MHGGSEAPIFPLVEFSESVQHYAPFFESIFAPDAFIEFPRYVSGLIISQNKTVEGINRLFVIESRSQSSLNHLLTASTFSLEQLNQALLELLAHIPATCIKPRGVLSVDEKRSRQVAELPAGVWQRQQKNHPELRQLYDSKLSLAQKLVQQWVALQPTAKLPVTFDNWFTPPSFCRFNDSWVRL